ncbi:MAG: hypothetical protein ABTQ26_07020, partial [Azonexus sp.]
MGTLTYTQVKTALDASIAETGGKYKPFDVSFYTAQAGINAAIPGSTYVPLAAFNGTPLEHYVTYGSGAGFEPNAWFDAEFYRAKYADTQVLAGADLLVHFSKFGANEGRAPSLALAQFDGVRYLADNPDVAAYVNANLGQFGGSVTNGSIAHYVKFGALEARQGFDTSGQLVPFSVFPALATITPSAAANGAIALSLNNNELSSTPAQGDEDKTTLTGSKVVADGATASTLRLTGTADVRVDFSNTASQVTGIDLNGDETISTNGVENNVSGAGVFTAKNFVSFDAYSRNPVSTLDRANNYTGNIRYDGTGYGGDGVSTDGNIVLGGMGSDTILGGIGNDFIAGGGTLATGGADTISGGRNSDFIFTELSLLSPADGNNLNVDGGETADNVTGTQNALVDAAGSTNDRDWILLEASDDDEPTTLTLTDAAPGGANLQTRANAAAGTLSAIEAVDASGNLYGFLNDIVVELGHRATDSRIADPVIGTENFGEGSTAQLIINGSGSANIVVAGYDNDTVTGGGGNDVLFGGNLDYLLKNANNPNLLNATKGLDLNVNAVKTVTDGRDSLAGGNDDDAIVFEAASGTVDGNAAFDTLYITNESVGRLQGTTFNATYSDTTAQADALKALSGDQVMRFDLANAAGAQFRDYGGANRGLGVAPVETATGDQTNYVAALGTKPATTVANVEGLIATGLGDIDYKAAGSNSPELKFNNQQNYQGSVAKFDVRGVNSDANSTTKFGTYWTDGNFGQDGTNGALDNADAGIGAASVAQRDVGDNVIYTSIANDTIEGRLGDDELGGGKGDDNFIFDFGDNTDIVRRQADANGDNLWDVDASGNRTYSQDFRADPSGVTATRLQIDFGTTDLTSANVAVSNIFLTIEPGKTGAINLTANNLQSAKSISALAAAVDTAFKAIDASLSVVASGNSLIVSDTKGRDISDTTAEGYAVFVAVGNASASTTATLNPGGSVIQENDRVLFVDYLDRTNNSWIDNTNSEVRNQAQDLVVGNLGTSSVLAQGNVNGGQEWRIQLQNIAEGDKVSINVNGYKIERSAAPGETTDAFVAALVAQINGILDLNTAAGDLSAAQANVNAGNVNESVIVLQQDASGNADNRVFMSQPTVTITPINGASSSATSAIANTSNSSIELLNYKGTDGGLNETDVLFLGRSGQAAMATADSVSILKVAKDAGETLTGKDASVVALQRDAANAVINTNVGNVIAAGVSATTVYHAINGDDQLIGGAGNDIINGMTGDDRIIGSKGTDTVDGGGNTTTAPTASALSGEVINYTDTLLFQESDFGTGTKFTVTLDAALGTAGAGKGVVTAVLGTATLGTTTFTNVEEVRTASNTAQDTIDYALLSNAVAAATGASANLNSAGGNVVIPTVAGTDYNEGTVLNLTIANAGFAYAVDRNGDNDTNDAGEISGQPVAVFGVENVLAGSANDIVNMDQSQAGSTNVINLGGQQSDTAPTGDYIEGRDLVTYTHAGVAAASRPSMTVTVESGSDTDSVSMTGGVLGTTTVIDTLINVEELTITTAATTQTVAGDTLDLSKVTTGATVNFGAAGVTVGRTLGGQVTPLTSVAAVESNTLETGGIASSTANLGTELLEINGITQLERITGSAGNDRIIFGDAGGFANANGSVAALGYDNAKIGVNFFANYNTATRAFNTATSLVDNQGLYQVNLGDGTSDSLDYRTAGNDQVTVIVDFAADQATAVDYVVVDNTANAVFNDAGDRVDLVRNTERFYSNANGAIDTSRATEAVTVTFGVEALATANEVKDPNGIDTNAGATKTADNQVTGITVGTATTAVAARFMQSSVNAATGSAATDLWNRVEGSNQNDTVVFSQYQDRTTVVTVNARGGNNVVDYTNAVATGQNDVYSLSIGEFNAVGNLGATGVHTSNNITHTSTTDVGSTDVVTLDRQLSLTNVNTDGAILFKGSSNTNDTVTLNQFVTALTGLNKAGADNDLTGLKKDGTAATAEEANVRDITDTKAGGYHLVDLGSGLGVTTGTVVQDVNLNFKGAAAVANNVTTSISGWENITGSANNDRLFGNDNNNVITGNGGADTYQGRGGGDTLNLGAGNDRVVFATPGDTADTLAGNNKAAAGEFDVVTGFGVAGADRIAFDLTTTAANGGFNLVSNLVQEQAALGAVNTALGGIILVDVNDLDTAANLLDMTVVAAKLGASATVTASAAGTQLIYAIDATTQTNLYLWTSSAAGDTTVGAAELRLLATVDVNDIDPVAGAATFGVDDLAVRKSATNTGVADTVLLNAAVRDEVVYTALNQSQYGQIDTLGKFNGAGVVINGFEVGVDKIDLSGLGLGTADGLAVNAIIVRDRTGAGSQITDANANDFFYGGDNVRRAVVVEFDNDDIDGGVGGVQARARVFVDLNGNGQLDTTGDLFIDLAT